VSSNSSLSERGKYSCAPCLEATTVFGPVLESSRLSPTVPRTVHNSGVDGARVGSSGCCLARSLLGSDVFPHGGMRWMF
jgi:hypothetical protein